MVKDSAAGRAGGSGEAAGWRRTLWVMVGIQFVMTMAFSVLSPIMPLFLPQLGVETPEGVDLWAGILAGVTSFVAAFVSPLWGRLADRRGRKLMLLRSSLAIAAFTALMGMAGDVWQFFAARALMGAFAGFSSAAIALVASQVPEERLGFSLGWLSTGQLVGSLIGPLIGGALADTTGSYRIPFYCTAVTISSPPHLFGSASKSASWRPGAAAASRCWRACWRWCARTGSWHCSACC